MKVEWDLEKKGEVINQSMNHKGVCRTAVDTPGLLNIAVIDTGFKRDAANAILDQ